MLDLLIVGAGPAGCAAAVQARRLGLSPRLLDRTGRAGGLVEQAWQVENYPGLPPLPGPAVVRLLGAHLQRFGLGVTEEEVGVVLPQEDHLELRCASNILRSRAVILAVGTVPVPLQVSGAEHLRYEIRSLLAESPAAAAVVGAGEAGLDHALALDEAGIEVHLIVRGGRLRATGRLVQLVGERPGVHVHLHTRLVEVLPRGAVVLGPEGEQRLAVDYTVASIGRTSCLPQLGVDSSPEAGIVTRHPGLYLAGDARSGGLGQLGVAVGDGLAAAMVAARELNLEDPRPDR